ncbi:hypothetical protein AX15_004187 [Amanita polypyramis BW_CC]|nr:hypothetical protein AX15_004187 [Amanita polypyramis BW_CC]
MEILNKSLQALQEYIRKNEVTNASDSIKVFAFISDILSPSAPQVSFKKLCLVLRSRMLPLYRITPKYALGYAAAILAAFSDVKAKDAERKECWESAQESLLSGILDYLEQHQTNENQTLIASIFYPHLCTEFFPPHDKSVVNAQDSLLCTIFQLLSESAISHPVNQHKLRDPNMLGGKRLGLMLVQCKDFLAMEALLELFGNIIPATKNPDRRANFIQEVFNPTQFECSAKIVQLLERVQSTGWDTASTKISDTLAKSDASYPQPFETTQIRTQEASYTVSRIYIDKDALIASVEEDGQLETFKLPFRSVKRIQISAPSAFMATVTASVASSPLLGHSPIIRNNTNDMSISFDLRKEEVANFVVILRKRDLECAKTLIHGKISKAESHIELAFESRDSNDLPSLEEKIENLAMLWKSNKLPEDTDQNAATSPLRTYTDTVTKEARGEDGGARVTQPRCLEAQETSGTSNLQTTFSSVRKSPQHDAIFGASGEELSEISDVEIGEMDNMVSVGARHTSDNDTRQNFHHNESKNQSTRTGSAQAVRRRNHVLYESKIAHGASQGSFNKNPELTSNSPVIQFPHNLTPPTIPSSDAELTPPKPGRYGKRNIILSLETNAGVRRSDTMTSKPSYDAEGPKAGDATAVRVSVVNDSTTKTCAESRKRNINPGSQPVSKPALVVTDSDFLITLTAEPNTCRLGFSNTPDALRSRQKEVHISAIPIGRGGCFDPASEIMGRNCYELLTTIDTTKAPSDRNDRVKSPRSTKLQANGNDSRVFIDLTADDLANIVSAPNSRPEVTHRSPIKEESDCAKASMSEGAKSMTGLEKPGDETNLSKDVHARAKMRNKAAGEDLLRAPYEFETFEGVPTIDITCSPSPDMFTERASVSFTIPPLMNEDRRAPTGDGRMQFTSVKLPRKRRHIDVGVNGQTQYRSRRNYPQGAKNYPRRRKPDTDAIPRIIEVVDKIHELVIDRTARRFDDVRKDIRFAQVKILESTKNDLREMQTESTRNYNEMVDLLKEYTVHEKKMVHAVGQLVDSEMDIIQGIKSIIHQHDRSSLSSKFPKTVLPSISAPFNVRFN